MFRQMIDPDPFHGRLPWNRFEGWYFKVCSDKAAFAFIPGVFFGSREEEPHSFLQILEGDSVTYDYVRFPVKSFNASQSSMEINICQNSFSDSGIRCAANTQAGLLTAALDFQNIIRWDDCAGSHRSMGFYNFLPYMECYSQVCVMDMDVTGQINVNGKIYDFTEGKGYIEKNWGSQFPLSWLWVQCNSFGHSRASLSLSAGHIPFFLGTFKGFLVGLQTETGFYPFTSMNGSRLEESHIGRDREIVVHNSNFKLEVATQSSEEGFMLCNGPKGGWMMPYVKETLTAEVYVRLTDKLSGRLLFEDQGSMAGIEYGGQKTNSINNS